MKILLSIKPEFVKEIFEGNKKFEYRKSIFKRNDVNTVIVYSTKPVGRIVGEFSIEKILKSSPIQLWEATSEYSGITKSDFDKYINTRRIAYAYQIKNPVLYDNPIDPNSFSNRFFAPQSFKYIQEFDLDFKFSF